MALLYGGHAFATTRYITQSGGTATCHGSSQVTITPATWNSTSESAGDISYICGTITGSVGQTLLTFSWDGSPGNPIQLIFDTGAILTSPQWGGGASGAINASGHNFITIDGGTNGIIRNTASGSVLANTGDSMGVWCSPSCSNVTIKNINFSNLYVRTQSDTTTNGNSAAAFQDVGTMTNVAFDHNICDHVRFCAAYSFSGTSSNTAMTNNTINFVETAFFIGDISSSSILNGLNISGNSTAGGSYLWDGNSNFHHDPLTHVFAVNTGSSVNSLVISNNQATGQYTAPGGPNTAWIFLEGGIPSPQIFNNIATTVSADPGFSNGYFAARGNVGAVSNFSLYNNTFRGNSDINTIGNGQCMRITGGPSSTGTIKNNIFDNCGTAVDVENPGVTFDYNYYYNFTGSAWFIGGIGFDTFSQWQATGQDAHAICGRTGGASGGCANGGDPLLNPSAPPYTLQAGSPAIGAGLNLTSLGITGLSTSAPQTFGISGACGAQCNFRPGTGTWDMGAYQFSGGSPPANPFSQTNNCPATLTATTSCTITVFFQPQVVGTQTANLSVASNAATSPNLAALTGIGATAAAITLSPSFINFGNVPVGTTSVASSIIVANSGGVSTTISSIAASANFSQTNNCPGSLASGSNCTINVTASPTTTGTFNGTITVTASAAGSPFIASLSMTGVTPVVSLSPTSINFGNQPVNTGSTVQSLTLTNTGTSNLTFAISKVGTNPGDFSVSFGSGTGCTSPLVPNASCVISVSFVPTTTGARSAIVRITDNASGSPHDVPISGTGIPAAPAVCLSSPSFTFGNQTVGTTSVAQTETVTNCGTANLVISSASVTGDFNRATACATVAPQATCTISLTFAPTATGTRNGNLTILSNAASSPDVVALSGTGVTTGATVLPTTLSFGSVTVGIQSAGQTVTVTNTGSLSLVVNTPTMSGTNPGDYSFGGVCGTVAPNSNCQYSVAFTPGGAGSRTATFNQTFGGGVATQTVALSGTGIAAVPVVQLVPTSINFGNVQQHTQSATQTITLTNTGNAVLNIASIAATGANAADMTVVSHCGATLAAGTPCTVDTSCTPSTTAAESANVTFTTDAASSPNNLALTCTGTAAPAPHIKTPLPTLTFPATQVGSTSGAQVATITNDGNANLVATFVTIAGSNPGDFLQSNNCTTVIPAASCAITVNFKPTAAGSRSASISIASNAASSPDSVTVSGTGVAGAPNMVIALTNINFGNQTVGVLSSPVVFTLSNTGTATATGVVVTITSGGNDYTVTDNCGGSIGAGGSCSAQVRFQPQQLCGQFAPANPSQCISNTHLGTVRVLSNTSQSPQTVSLQGTAIQVPPAGPVKVSMGGHMRVGGSIRINR